VRRVRRYLSPSQAGLPHPSEGLSGFRPTPSIASPPSLIASSPASGRLTIRSSRIPGGKPLVCC
jgi:hypothetical protein